MESLRRALMLLKPGEGFKIPPGKNGGTLKLRQSGTDTIISLTADCIGEGDYFLYLFSKDGKELYAGDVRDGALNTALPGLMLDDVTGAAVVRREGNDHFFCLKSTGPDWAPVIGRFRTVRNAPKSFVSAAPGTDLRIEDIPDIEIPYIENTAPAAFEPHEIAKELENDEAAQEHTEESAEAGFEETGCDECARPHESSLDPFPSIFPNSEWVKVSYPGPAGWWHYISGKIYKGGALVAKALGVPGEYGMTPPIWLEGFGTYLRCVSGDARGYWLMFQDAETGEVLDMGLSQRGG